MLNESHKVATRAATAQRAGLRQGGQGGRPLGVRKAVGAVQGVYGLQHGGAGVGLAHRRCVPCVAYRLRGARPLASKLAALLGHCLPVASQLVGAGIVVARRYGLGCWRGASSTKCCKLRAKCGGLLGFKLGIVNAYRLPVGKRCACYHKCGALASGGFLGFGLCFACHGCVPLWVVVWPAALCRWCRYIVVSGAVLCK